MVKKYENLPLTSILEKLETVVRVARDEILKGGLREIMSNEEIVFVRYWPWFKDLYEELNKRYESYTSKK